MKGDYTISSSWLCDRLASKLSLIILYSPSTTFSVDCPFFWVPEFFKVLANFPRGPKTINRMTDTINTRMSSIIPNKGNMSGIMSNGNMAYAMPMTGSSLYLKGILLSNSSRKNIIGNFPILLVPL